MQSPIRVVHPAVHENGLGMSIAVALAGCGWLCVAVLEERTRLSFGDRALVKVRRCLVSQDRHVCPCAKGEAEPLRDTRLDQNESKRLPVAARPVAAGLPTRSLPPATCDSPGEPLTRPETAGS